MANGKPLESHQGQRDQRVAIGSLATNIRHRFGGYLRAA